MNDDHRTPDDVEARLRRTLQAVAATTTVEDRRTELLAAVAAVDASDPAAPDPEDDAMHLDPRPDPARPIWRRPLFLAAAAALVVVVVLGAAVADDPDVEIDPAVPDESPDESPDEIPETGWYLPPEGWEITEVRADFLDVADMGGACPCRSWVAAEEGPEPAAIIVGEASGPFEAVGVRLVDVDGREGEVLEPGGDLSGLVVASGGTHLSVVGSRVDVDVLVDLADSWLDQVEAGDDVDPGELALPERMSAGEVVASPATSSVHLVDVTAVERSSGRRAYYQVVPAGAGYQSLILDAGAVAVRGGSFEVRTSIGVTPVVAVVGGSADVAAGPSAFAEEGDLEADELAPFLAGLRQVSLTGWRAALGDAVVAPEVAAADTLFGPPLVDGPVDG